MLRVAGKIIVKEINNNSEAVYGKGLFDYWSSGSLQESSINFAAWGKLAENIGKYWKPDRTYFIYGKLQMGKAGYYIALDGMDFSLSPKAKNERDNQEEIPY